MRHLKSGRHLNRTASHRKQMFANMCASLIEHEVIKTTVPKAKELRRFFEPLVTRASEDTVANRRLAFAFLRNREAVRKLYEELGPRLRQRPGGYTRILKAGHRNGDAAMVAYIELVDRFDADGFLGEQPTEEPATAPQRPETEPTPAEPEAAVKADESTEVEAASETETEEAESTSREEQEEKSLKRSQWWKMRNPFTRRRGS